MQLPKRRHQLLKTYDESDDSRFLSVEGINRLKRRLYELENVEHPRAVEDVSVAHAKGDLSENAEYQEAKSRLARIDGNIFSIKEKVKNAIPIERGADSSGRIRLGSTVLLDLNGKERSYDIVGPQEADPSRNRISHLSPLGSALLGRVAGDVVHLETGAEYRIVQVE